LACAIDPPTFEDQYTAIGVILLPYAQLREPFTAYYDGQLNQSRIDYYDDLMLTLQKSPAAAQNGLDYGVEYKIAYDVDVKDNAQQVCFQSNGSSDNIVGPQTILPDLTGFVYIGKESCPRVSLAQVRWNKFNSRKLGNEFGSLRPKQTNMQHGRHCDKWQLKVTVEEKVSTYTFWARKDAKTDNFVPVHYEMMGFNSLLGSHYDQYEIAYFNWRAGTNF
jgi:hypothetical protein